MMITDSTNALAESSETNNQLTKTMTWQAPLLPDVSASSIITDPNPPTGGQSATIRYTVSVYQVPWSGTAYTGLYIDGFEVANSSFVFVAGTTSLSYSFTTTLAIGNHEIKLITDSTHVITESNETNNQLIKTIYWQAPMPDFAAYDIFTLPAPPIGGVQATIYYQISINMVPWTGTVYTDLYIDGSYAVNSRSSLVWTAGMPSITTYGYMTTLAIGNHVIKIITDSTDAFTESSETNNQLIKTTNWQVPLPELTIANIWTTPASPISGQSATINAQVLNQYGDIRGTNFINRLYVDGAQVADQSLNSLAKNKLGPAWSAARTLGPGYHNLSASADVTDSVHEYNEGNNNLSKSIWWASPDLIVVSITAYNEVTGASITSIYSGWPIRIDVVVKNNGDTTAGASTLELQDILSGLTTVLGTTSIGALAAGASTTWSFTGKYLSATGTHTIRAVADKNGAVSEANKATGADIGTGETNNAFDKTNFVVSLSSWTAAIYMDADELSFDGLGTLESQANKDLGEMQAAGSLYGSLNIIVMVDMYSSGAKVYIVLQGSLYQIADRGEVNMGDPATLSSFLATYSLGRFQASQSMLVLWDHGGGCIGGIFGDEHVPSGSSADNSMSLPDLTTALNGGLRNIEILAFHACLMSSIEVGFQAYSAFYHADILVGFEDLANADGFPYGSSTPYTDGIFNYMRENPIAGKKVVAGEIVNRTYRSYQSGGSQDNSNDNDAILSVAAYYNYFGAPASISDVAYDVANVGYILYHNSYWYDAKYVRDRCDDFASPVGIPKDPVTPWQNFYIDIYDFMDRLSDQASFSGNMDLYYACQTVLIDLSKACINYKTGSDHPTAHGLSLYFPKTLVDRDMYETTYDALAMSHSYSLWETFIDQYPYPA